MFAKATVVAPVKLVHGPAGVGAHSTRYTVAVGTRLKHSRPVPSNDRISDFSARATVPPIASSTAIDKNIEPLIITSLHALKHEK
jgi:hypothetical protein